MTLREIGEDARMHRPWGWAVQYGIAILLALLLGAILGSIPLFQETTLAGTKLRASHFVEFVGYGSALLLFWLAAYQATSQIPDDRNGLSVLRHLATPLLTLLVVTIAYNLCLLLADPLLGRTGKAIYNWAFVIGMISAAVWLIMAWVNHSEPLFESLGRWWVSMGPNGQRMGSQASGEAMFLDTGRLKNGRADRTVLLSNDGIKPTLGRYEIIRELGRGAMGVVYLGRDPMINRSVAIKTMRLDEADPGELPGVRERFFREAESTGRLKGLLPGQ